MSKLQLPIVITPTRAELAARCHRRHFLADILGKARYYSPSLEFGSVIHAGVAAHWLAEKTGKTITFDSVIADAWKKQHVESPKGDLTEALAVKMLEYYASSAELAGPFTAQGNWKLVDVEQRFELPLKDVKLSFQCDRIVHDPDQDWLVIVDSKTAQRLDAKWERQWETSLQMKLYRAGARQVFGHYGRIDVVVEGILKHVPSDIRYCVCPEWSDGLLNEAAHNAYVLASMDRDLLEQGLTETSVLSNDGLVEEEAVVKTYTPDLDKIMQMAVSLTPVNYFDCYSYGVECPFRRICVADVDQRVPILKAEYFDLDSEY